MRIDDGQPADVTALRHALSSGPAQTWTGIEVTVTGELDGREASAARRQTEAIARLDQSRSSRSPI
ncbi:MAG: hypothetical protein JWM19_6488 [Actinomycetia bacterium]|nr:hypothetical protein [Actinomycetes bacterium]